MSSKNIVIAALVVLVVIFGALFAQKRPVVTVVQNPDGSTTVSEPVLGAVPTLDGIDNPYVSIGGVRQYWWSKPMLATSSVVCSVKNPFNATSTILRFSALVTANGLGAQVIDLATSTTAYGTSSPAFLKAFSTGTGQWYTKWTYSGTTTANLVGSGLTTTGSSADNVIGPSEYINFKIASSSAGTFSSYYTGYCKAIIERF